MKTIVKLGFTIDELSPSAKKRALDEFRHINVEDHDWWDFDCLTGFSTDEGKKYKFKTIDEYNDLLEYDKMYFDIDRGSYLQFKNPRFRDLEQARKFLGIDRRLWKRAQYAYFFETAGYSRDGDTVLNWNDDDGEREWTAKEQAQLDRASERFNDKRDDCLRILRDEAEYQQSDEAVEEMLRINDYLFDAEGNYI